MNFQFKELRMQFRLLSEVELQKSSSYLLYIAMARKTVGLHRSHVVTVYDLYAIKNKSDNS